MAAGGTIKESGGVKIMKKSQMSTAFYGHTLEYFILLKMMLPQSMHMVDIIIKDTFPSYVMCIRQAVCIVQCIVVRKTH